MRKSFTCWYCVCQTSYYLPKRIPMCMGHKMYEPFAHLCLCWWPQQRAQSMYSIFGQEIPKGSVQWQLACPSSHYFATDRTSPSAHLHQWPQCGLMGGMCAVSILSGDPLAVSREPPSCLWENKTAAMFWVSHVSHPRTQLSLGCI